MAVNLAKADASAGWVFTREEETKIHNGELVLDGLAQKHVYAFLKEPVLSDLTVEFKVYVEPTGAGVRAFGIRFHSPGSLCAQFVHVYPDRAVLAWADEAKDFHEVLRNNSVPCPLGTWHGVKLVCRGANVKAFLDGKVIFDHNDERWKAGRVGFHTSQGLVRIKDIRVEGTAATLAKPWRLAKPPPPGRTFHELPPDVRHTDVSGTLELTVSKPSILSSQLSRARDAADNRYHWGKHQFPGLFRYRDGALVLGFNIEGDFLGARGTSLGSRDNGRTWGPPGRGSATIELQDGTVLSYDMYGFMKEPGVFAKGMRRSRDGGKTFGGPLLAMVASPLSTTKFKYPDKCVERYKKTSAQWSPYCGGNFSGSVIELEDGTLLADGCALFKGYPKDYYKHIRVVLYRSTDKGMTWQYLSTVAYDPSNGHGFHEPVTARCADGSLLCVMRTQGHKPLMQTRSRDNGKTWETPKPTGALGVLPRLCLMSNGVLACSYGRPGNRITFSTDGTGETWADRLKLYEYNTGSTGYTAIAEVEPGKLLLAYDRHDAFPELGGRKTTVIQGVTITVRKK